MRITMMTDFVDLFPPGTVERKSANELSSPCPFCTASDNGEVHIHNNITFYGRHRLVWWLGENRFFCRHCNLAGRGHNGVYFVGEVARIFGAEVDSDIGISTVGERELPLRMLWSANEVYAAHRKVDYAFWERFGWTRDTINYFQLGRGTVYSADGPVNVIPMRVQKPYENPLPDYVIATREPPLSDGRDHPGNKKRTPGSIKPYVWMIERYRTNPEDLKTIVIAEGEKDAISLSQLGFNVACSFGTNMWSLTKTQFLIALGYSRIIVFSDNDIPGYAFVRNAASQARTIGIELEYLEWNALSEPAKDITEYLEAHPDMAAARQSLLAALEIAMPFSTTVKATSVADYSDLDVSYQASDVLAGAVSLDDIRGNGPRSLYTQVETFLEDYAYNRSKGGEKLLILGASPGAGKTHTLIRVLEAKARAVVQNRLQQLEQMQQDIETAQSNLATITDPDQRSELQSQIASMVSAVERFSISAVAWYGQYKEGWNDLTLAGADPNMWYNFEARNAVNCEEYTTVQQLSSKGHDIGAYCKLGCPLRQACEQTGYLSQEVEARKKPIVFYRHQHLRMESSFTDKSFVVVDENPMPIIDGAATQITITELQAASPGWQEQVEDRRVVLAINALVNASVDLLLERKGIQPYNGVGNNRTVNTDYLLFGNQFIRALNKALERYDTHLEEVLSLVSNRFIETVYQPTYVGGDQEVRLFPRYMPAYFHTLRVEHQRFLNDPDAERSSLIFMIGGSMIEAYPTEVIKIPYRIPIIVADATALVPEALESMFRRPKSRIYAPMLYNPNANISVVVGSDWTLTSIERQLGKTLKNYKALLKAAPKNILMEPQDLSDAAIEAFPNKMVEQAIGFIRGLGERHPSLLVVTHLKWKELLETVMSNQHRNLVYSATGTKRISFGHYGALRGTNIYKDYAAVMLLGMWRIPYDVIYRRAQVWMSYIAPEQEEHIPYETVIRFKPYKGQTKGHGYRTFDHWLAALLVDQVEEAEMIQCMERIRPHATSEAKHVYIFANRPCASLVTNVVNRNDLLPALEGASQNIIYNQIMEALKADSPTPPIRLLAKQHNKSTREIQRIRTQAVHDYQKILTTRRAM